ncbi:MAG: hypothetical protein EBZ22_03405, partial [Flavobacteriia bacterium]|nr:hypothetical protein [Flavobacteriia bacterium]
MLELFVNLPQLGQTPYQSLKRDKMSVTCQGIQESRLRKAQMACQFAKNQAVKGAIRKPQVGAVQRRCTGKYA